MIFILRHFFTIATLIVKRTDYNKNKSILIYNFYFYKYEYIILCITTLYNKLIFN